MRNVIIVGSGPAGLTAAIYAGRANLSPLVIEGLQPGGQLTTAPHVENFPGFEEGISGYELMELMKKQAVRFGSEIVSGTVNKVDFKKSPFEIEIDDRIEHTKAVIIATGASAHTLGIPSESKLIGRGISVCATCDGFFYKNKEVVVVGGGDSAMEEALYLSKICKKVILIHRRDEFRASKIMQERVRTIPNINLIMDMIVEEFISDQSGEELVGLRLKNVKTNELIELPTDGVFLAVSRKPNSGIFKGQLELDEKGYIVVHNDTESSVRGIFAAGDVVNKRYKQAITAAGMGCMAALDCEKYLEKMESSGRL